VANEIKWYRPTWDGDLLLACRKCQKKLKDEPGMRALAKLKKTVKRHNKAHPDAAMHVIGVPCMDLCPKMAVTVCRPSAGAAMLSVLRNESELERMYRVSD